MSTARGAWSIALPFLSPIAAVAAGFAIAFSPFVLLGPAAVVGAFCSAGLLLVSIGLWLGISSWLHGARSTRDTPGRDSLIRRGRAGAILCGLAAAGYLFFWGYLPGQFTHTPLWS